jgi:hypothetical protein
MHAIIFDRPIEGPLHGTLQNKNIGTIQVQKLLFLKKPLFGNLNYVFLDFRK